MSELQKTKYDNAPWEISTDDSINGYRLFSHYKYLGFIGNSDEDKQQSLANAKLVVAAPDLLEALIACDEAMAYISEYDIPIMLSEKVKAAIAKATGGVSE